MVVLGARGSANLNTPPALGGLVVAAAVVLTPVVGTPVVGAAEVGAAEVAAVPVGLALVETGAAVEAPLA